MVTRRWTLSEKQRIVAESYAGRRLVSATARRNGLSASQLFTWRRLAREGRLVEADDDARFAQAVISCEPSTSSLRSHPDRPEAAENLPSSSCAVGGAGSNGELRGGRRVIVDNGVDAATLGRVIDVLERRR
ncbi:MAG: IS66-like element accessory protein TnpA [Beijerinckiaceae bacterium]